MDGQLGTCSLVAWTKEDSLLDASCLIKGLEPCCAVAVAIFAVCCGLRLDDGVFHMLLKFEKARLIT
jgi:hypothetical protein